MRETDVGATRIGTWNLEGKWSTAHADLISSLACDVLLLTETRREIVLDGYEFNFTQVDMQPGRAWAAIASRIGLKPLPDPHPASAMAEVGGVRMCSSILPWRNAGAHAAFIGSDTSTRTHQAVKAIVEARPTIWGGDWNHSLHGREYVGSMAGRAAILSALGALGLMAPTSELPARNDGQSSIDHIAIPLGVNVTVQALRVDRKLSDHDAYVLDVRLPDRGPG